LARSRLHLNVHEFTKVTPRYLCSLLHGIATPVDDTVFSLAILHLGPKQIQLHFLKLINISTKYNSSSHLLRSFSSLQTEGTINSLLSAYSIIKVAFVVEHEQGRLNRQQIRNTGGYFFIGHIVDAIRKGCKGSQGTAKTKKIKINCHFYAILK